MKRIMLGIGVLMLLTPQVASAQLQEMRQTIFGMD